MDKKLTGLILVFFLTVSLFITLLIFNQPLLRLTRAKEEFLPSIEKSLIFAWPLTTKLNTNVSINVFIRNEKGVPLPNKNVILSTTLGEIKPPSSITDKNGKANFTLTSSQTGLATISATVDNDYRLNQNVSIKFE